MQLALGRAPRLNVSSRQPRAAARIQVQAAARPAVRSSVRWWQLRAAKVRWIRLAQAEGYFWLFSTGLGCACLCPEHARRTGSIGTHCCCPLMGLVCVCLQDGAAAATADAAADR